MALFSRSFSHTFFSLICLINFVYTISIDSNRLQANGLTEPFGRLQTTTPRLSWVPLSDRRGDEQTAYQLQASSDEGFARANLWDTGKTKSANTSVVYAGKALSSRDRVYWRVRGWDKHGIPGRWSKSTFFELALMEQDDWTAKWIENNEYVMGENAIPVFAKEFDASCAPSTARLYILGLGVQSSTINGQPVTNEVLAPSYSTMNKTLFYSTYDVTKHIHPGKNVLGVELGKGSYDAGPGLDGRFTKFEAPGYPLPFKLISQLEYRCKAGKINTVISDASWKTTVDGPLLESSWYGGEEYDASRSLDMTNLLSGNRTSWSFANSSEPPHADLDPQLLSPEMPPLEEVETMPAQSVTQADASGFVFDFGQNFAGWFSFKLHGKQGKRLLFYPSELLDEETGSVDQSTTGSPIFDGYTFAGNGTEEHTLKFMYHGFRYLEVYGLDYTPNVGDVVGYKIRSTVASVGSSETNVQLFNQIHHINDEAIQSNFYSVLTDCPHREKMGWLDQDHLAIDPVLLGYDLRGYGRHMMKQFVDAQNAQGEVPTTAPQFDEFGYWPPYSYDQAANWGIAIIRFAWKHFQTYGDIEILEENYEAMQGYLQYLGTLNTTSIISVDLGDWAGVDQTTPFGLTGTSAYALGTQDMIQIATILGRSADVAEYTSLHKTIISDFNDAYYNTTDAITYASGSQASDAIALHIDAVARRDVRPVTNHLVQTIRSNGSHLSVGEVGLEAFFNVLSKNHNDVLYDVMAQTDFPSYGYMVASGATTMWEHWDGAGSHNHFMLGYSDTWLWWLSGMKQAKDSIAWQSIDFNPIIVGDVKSARASYDSVKGTVVADWKLSGRSLTYTVTVPVGSVGKVVLPAPRHFVKLDGRHIVRGNGVLSVRGQLKRTTIRVGSGTYNFTAAKIMS